MSDTNASLEAALAVKSEEAQKAAVEVASLKVEHEKETQKAAVEVASLKVEHEKVQTAAAIPADVEAELSTIKQKLTEKEKETSRLVEENERLSEQVLME